jgi:hypothetical protein
MFVSSVLLIVTNLRQSRRLEFVNRSKRLKLAPPKGGRVQYSLNKFQLLQPLVLLFLILDVVPYCLFVTTHRGHEVAISNHLPSSAEDTERGREQLNDEVLQLPQPYFYL